MYFFHFFFFFVAAVNKFPDVQNFKYVLGLKDGHTQKQTASCDENPRYKTGSYEKSNAIS